MKVCLGNRIVRIFRWWRDTICFRTWRTFILVCFSLRSRDCYTIVLIFYNRISSRAWTLNFYMNSSLLFSYTKSRRSRHYYFFVSITSYNQEYYFRKSNLSSFYVFDLNLTPIVNPFLFFVDCSIYPYILY